MKTEMISFIAVFVVLIIIGVLLRNRNKASGQREYDERQLLIRGKAYTYAAIVMVICGILYAIYVSITDKPLAQDGVGVLLLSLLGIAVYAVYSIFHDAFFSFRQKPMTFFLVAAIIVVVNVAGSLPAIRNHELVADGVLTISCLQLALAALFFVILIGSVIRMIMVRSEGSYTE